MFTFQRYYSQCSSGPNSVLILNKMNQDCNLQQLHPIFNGLDSDKQRWSWILAQQQMARLTYVIITMCRFPTDISSDYDIQPDRYARPTIKLR